MMRRILILSLFSCLAIQATYAEVLVIVHPSNAASMDKGVLADIFLGKSNQFPNGSDAVPIDLTDDNTEKAVFYGSVANKDLSQLSSYWSKLIFTGKGKLPKALDDVDEVLELVASNPSMIGYVDADSLDDSVKVILTIP